jgi:iron uptake system component EfeO
VASCGGDSAAQSAAASTSTSPDAATQCPTNTSALKAATAGFRSYVESQTVVLVQRTTTFVAAIDAGELAKAKSLFATARAPYESIEPVAEAFGTLDPRIDARVNDLDEGQAWSGFHRLEQSMWVEHSLTGMRPIADQLLADVQELEGKVRGLTYTPADLANGSTRLLDEVSKSKITGEEDRYSHTDLSDFAANVDGAQRAFALLEPALTARDASLATTIAAHFTAVDSALAQYRHGSAYVSYRALTPSEIKQLAEDITTLAEPLSQVANIVCS